MFSEVTFPILGAHCAMISDDDFSKEMWVGPDIWVPPTVADYLISRMQWIKEGEKTDFQVGAPAEYEVDDLNTLAYLIVTGDFAAAKELADNLPRPQMWMEPSSSLVDSKANCTMTNPFKRRRRRKNVEKKEMEKEEMGKDQMKQEVVEKVEMEKVTKNEKKGQRKTKPHTFPVTSSSQNLRFEKQTKSPGLRPGAHCEQLLLLEKDGRAVVGAPKINPSLTDEALESTKTGNMFLKTTRYNNRSCTEWCPKLLAGSKEEDSVRRIECEAASGCFNPFLIPCKQPLPR